VTEDVDPDLGTLLETSGTLTIVDPDPGESSFQAATIVGTYGSLTIDAAGGWSYAADNTRVAIQQLDAGESLSDILTVTTADGTTHNMNITINGTEDAPVIGGTTTGTVAEDSTLKANGTLTISDVDISDNPISFPDEAIILGDNGYGDFVLTGGNWTYTLNNAHAAVQALDVGESLTDTHIFRASDGSTQLVTMTINGAEDAPIAVDDAISGNEDTVITGNVLTNDTDTEADPLTARQVSGPAHGSLTLNADGSFSYTPNADWNGTDSFTYTANNGALDSNVATMTITVNPVNDAPSVSSSAATTATENAAYSYTITANDIDGDGLTITASTLPAWLTLVDNGDGTATLSGTPTNTDVGEHSVELDISDGELIYLQDFTLTVSAATIDPPADDTDPDLRGSTTPDPELFENPDTDDEKDPDVKAPTHEDQPQDPVIEAEQAAPVVEDLTPQGSAHAEDQLIHMQDPQINEEILYLTDDDDMDSQSEERDDDPSITYYDNDLYKDLSLSKYVNINYTAADGPNLKSEDDLNILYLDSDDSIPVDVNGDYDLHRQQIDESFDIELKSQAIKAKIVSVTAASFAAGFVSYLLRAGSLVANLMSTLPLWRGFDPIVIFSGDKKKKKKDRNDIPDTNEAKSETLFDDEVK
jgi:VCBS repeat-containing protein